MFPRTLRFVLIVACVVWGAVSLLSGDSRGVLLLLAAAILAWGYFRYGTVWLAFRALQRGDASKARKLVAQISHPELLGRQSRAYLDWIEGAFAFEDGNLELAREVWERAAAGGLRTSSDKCIVHCQLAAVSVELGDREAAAEYLARARTFPHKPATDGLLSRVEKLLDEGTIETDRTTGA